MTEETQLALEDIAPILGQHQLTIISQDKLIRKLRERIMELEAKQPLDVVANGKRVDGVKEEV